ncbi:bifunctional diguanylate cyclase/phosphodiesterase [Oryzifoliimicrobium ureilyticus]|uniref:bifunctional diguanylate cyclase/phosphodiesterase n=1 Tax=Oryzifoliimicrobium ureilyticus TaxID=3113724 RepID=UPI0030767262
MPGRASLRINTAAGITFLFVLVICMLGALIYSAVTEMRDQANELDDARAVHAAQSAIRSFRSRLNATVRDNAVWDEAYTHLNADDGQDWVYENWGKTSQDYPLYDAAVVISSDGQVFSAHLKGEQFDPIAYFGSSIQRLAMKTLQSGKDPVTVFVATRDGPYLISAGAIQPYKALADKPSKTLLFAKRLTKDVISTIDKAFDIEGLELVTQPSGNLLSLPLIDLDGRAIAYFHWPSRLPGTSIYNAVHGYLLSALTVLIGFLVAMLVTGAVIIRNLHMQASMAEKEATHDVLTGLLNRAGLLQAIAAPLSGRAGIAPVGLGLIDLDGFKEVNDSWGHAVGDELIKLVADRLRNVLSDKVVLARLGGDEFAFLRECDEIDAQASAVIEALRVPFRIGGRTIEVGASIGLFSDADVDLEGLEALRRADMALYEAKEAGRGCVVVYREEMDIYRQERALLEEKLRTALTLDQIQPVYQPLVDAKTGQLRGVEALARWRPDTGPVSPEVFIPAAERAGLIDELGEKILDAAARTVARWGDVELSVNVSPVQLRNPEFAERVERILLKRKFEPERLTLEITEGVLMSNPEQAKRAIARLKSMGVRFALDDFGCGYASVGALREFGFDRMKIDRSMVGAIEEDKGADVLMATLALAAALDIPVTAEGVETQKQSDILTNSGCDQLQGYLVGRPMQPEDIASIYIASELVTVNKKA